MACPLNDDDVNVQRDAVLGHGVDGTVYKGVFRDQVVAVKELHTRGPRDVRRLIECSSPHVVRILAHNETQLVLEYMDMGNLRAHLDMAFKTSSTISFLVKLQIAYGIAQALEYFHSMDVVHGAIKSANVLLSTTKGVKLAHGGIAGPRTEALWTTAGAPFWTAPEALDVGATLQPSADIYSLGVILAELDTLKRPYTNTTMNSFAVLNDVRAGTRRPELRANCAEWYKRLTLSCLAFDPTARPSATDVVLCLRKQLDDESSIA
ncbi:serine/threonine protein kinase [Saprolegnia parasitica CBS 223.65]|uniref:Serine/threonine protein kinase n=1 Tax=Saprolegnia parasitica (strain CBS 223.65) TaxID=695850 RepID=A0A067BL70_SAPPC|nr:serine/threonine protein kinase [Saprolegnia parasitica CBS 223.65]KDO18958.1 serine/threonine protein kinase [Saprolegnia parasitica CBS 223.65]|eukprot:XP_012210339.1 serine/threonine protein kinase [Saprolegnia parasitica CBS 223.65]